MGSKDLRILIVEDEAAHVEAIQRALKAKGPDSQIRDVATLREYREIVAADPPDIVLMDLNLSDGRAMEVLTSPLEDGPFPILIMTSYGNELIAVKAMKAGAFDYIVKSPDAFADLPRVIERSLREWDSLKERKRAEEEAARTAREWQITFDATNDAICVLDQDHRVLRSNKATERLFHRPLGEMTGKHCWEIVYGTTQPIPECPVLRAQMSLRRETTELRLSERWFEVIADPILDATGRYSGAVHIVSDITKRKTVEAALQAKNEEFNVVLQQLWQAAKLATMGELASSIAHELNNPLTTVTLRIESLIAQTAEDDRRRRELEIIAEEVERMGNLVTNLLQFSRRSQRRVSTVDVGEEIEKTIELIHYHLRRNNIQVIKEYAPAVPKILADRQQLMQLFLNLLANAGDAMPEGGTLTIRVARHPEGKQIVIEIADTGHGIPPEILPKIAEPFYTTKPEGKGTGLGLAICRRIVQEHQGTLDITSEGISGMGSKVCITLPSKDEV